MTSAHIFYIPIILFVGLLAGYFLGQRAAERKLQKRREKLKRRRALQKQKQSRQDDENASSDSDAEAS